MSKRKVPLRKVAKLVRCTDEEFREIVMRLRHTCPPPAGCAVVCTRKRREIDGLENLAETEKTRRTFTITVSDELTETETIDAMIHEWAHVMSWRPYHPVDGDHDPVWGISFAVVYRQYHGTK